jgi:hypothetical protein
MTASRVVNDVRRATLKARWKYDDIHVFTGGPPPITRIEVLIYRPAADLDMTSFATVGMSAEPMPTSPGPGSGGRAELRLARGGALAPDDEYAIAVALANLAVHPWETGAQINWGHIVGTGGDFPTFPGCAVFLSGPLTPTGDDYIHTTDGPARIINVIPITDGERSQARTLPPATFINQLIDEVDIFAPRPAS